jgi:hypothetical protein
LVDERGRQVSILVEQPRREAIASIDRTLPAFAARVTGKSKRPRYREC